MIVLPVPYADYGQVLLAYVVASKIEPYTPAGFMSGGDTWFDGSGAWALADAYEWGQVWDKHVQNEAFGNPRINNLSAAPTVDFKKNFVVAIFAGALKNVVGYKVVRGIQVGNQASLRLAPVVASGNTASVALPRPWAFVVLPRTKAKVKIELMANKGWQTILTVPPSL